MKIEFSKPTLYFSHSVRGDGSISMEENCKRAGKVADKVRRMFPEINVWCPGDKDLTVQVLEDSGRLSVDDIIWADLEILRACHGYFWWWTSDSSGCQTELEEAIVLGLVKEPMLNHIISQDLLKASYSDVRRIFTPIVEDAKKRYQQKGS